MRNRPQRQRSAFSVLRVLSQAHSAVAHRDSGRERLHTVVWQKWFI